MKVSRDLRSGALVAHSAPLRVAANQESSASRRRRPRAPTHRGSMSRCARAARASPPRGLSPSSRAAQRRTCGSACRSASIRRGAARPPIFPSAAAATARFTVSSPASASMSAGMAADAAGPIAPSVAAAQRRTSRLGSASSWTSAGTAVRASVPHVGQGRHRPAADHLVRVAQRLDQRGHGRPRLGADLRQRHHGHAAHFGHGVPQRLAQGRYGGAGARAELAQDAGRVQPTGGVAVLEPADPEMHVRIVVGGDYSQG